MANENTMLEKMAAVKEQSQVCGEFLEFLLSKYIMFDKKIKRDTPCYFGSGDYVDVEKVLAEFFEIDLEQAEREKQEILRSLNH